MHDIRLSRYPDANAIFLTFFMAIKTEMSLLQRKRLLTGMNPLWRYQLALFLKNDNQILQVYILFEILQPIFRCMQTKSGWYRKQGSVNGIFLAFLTLEQVFYSFWLHLTPTLTSLIINIALHLQLPPPFTEFLLQNKNKFISSLGSNHESKHYWKIKILLCHVSIQNLKNKKIKKYIQRKQ